MLHKRAREYFISNWVSMKHLEGKALKLASLCQLAWTNVKQLQINVRFNIWKWLISDEKWVNSSSTQTIAVQRWWELRNLGNKIQENEGFQTQATMYANFPKDYSVKKYRRWETLLLLNLQVQTIVSNKFVREYEECRENTRNCSVMKSENLPEFKKQNYQVRNRNSEK